MTQAQALFARIDGRLTDWQRQFIRPMTVMWARFSGKGLPHVGKSALAALNLVLKHAPSTARWRGMIVKGKKATRVATHRDLSAFTPVTSALESLKTSPPGAFELYVKDGSDEHLAPDTFAAWLGVARTGDDTFAAPGGLLSFALPLQALEATTPLLSLGDELVETLRADSAGLSPGVWLAPHCLFNSSSNELPDHPRWLIELFGVDPQIDAPHLLASRWPHTAEETTPDLFSGLLAPSWAMWLDARLAKKVKTFPGHHERLGHATRYHSSGTPPFEMTEAVYRDYRAAWQALKPVQLVSKDTSPTGRFYRGRFSGETWSGQLTAWRDAETARQKQVDAENAMLKRLHEAEQKGIRSLLAVSEEARGIVEASSLCWRLVPALRDAIATGTVEPQVGQVWLDFGDEHDTWRSIPNRQQATLDAAALATVVGELERALALVKDAHVDHRGRPLKLDTTAKRKLQKDTRFKQLRLLPGWKKFVG